MDTPALEANETLIAASEVHRGVLAPWDRRISPVLPTPVNAVVLTAD